MPLISTSALADRLGQTELVICDVRFSLADHQQGRRDYQRAHIPGAVFVDLHTDLAAVDEVALVGGRHPLPSPDHFAKVLGRAGISPASEVVVYDDAGGAIAARLWWMLRSIGHGRVALLDGGITAWSAEGRSLDSGVVEPPPARYPTPAGWTGITTAEGVAAAAENGVVSVIDARSAKRFAGEPDQLDARFGHIPGAINLFFGDNLGPDGRFLPSGDLAARYADIGSDAIVYCGSGVTACHNLLAMTMVGLTGARLYPGSWSEWSRQPERPVATGAP